jgi:hypothetical protein
MRYMSNKYIFSISYDEYPPHWKKEYDTYEEALAMYKEFNNYGLAEKSLTILLKYPSGQEETKTFYKGNYGNNS